MRQSSGLGPGYGQVIGDIISHACCGLDVHRLRVEQPQSCDIWEDQIV